MMIAQNYANIQVTNHLLAGELVVGPTDTIYGIMARAADKNAVKKLYQVRHRSSSKPCIILVADEMDMPLLDEAQRARSRELNDERPTTIVIPVPDIYLPHLIRSDQTLAFRVVGHEDLAKIIRQTGPLLAPSANPEGLPPATTIGEAYEYFGDSVSVYVDGGTITNAKPSRIVKFENDGRSTVIRE